MCLINGKHDKTHCPVTNFYQIRIDQSGKAKRAETFLSLYSIEQNKNFVQLREGQIRKRLKKSVQTPVRQNLLCQDHSIIYCDQQRFSLPVHYELLVKYIM